MGSSKIWRLAISERNCLTENAVAQVGRQAGLGEDIYIDPKALLQVVGQRDQVEQAATLRHIDEKVEIAGATLLAGADRAEHAHIARPVGGSYAANVLPNRRKGDRSMAFLSPRH